MSIDSITILRNVLPNGYTVNDYIDSGGQGSVFLGTLNDREVAIKVFKSDHHPTRMEREIEVLRRLNCDFIVSLIQVDDITIDGEMFKLVAYEYYSGGDLRQFIEPGCEPISHESLIRIGKQIGCGLQCLWSERCVHRDVKPANIIRASDERYVLVDVALAMHLDLSQITAPGMLPGTQGYLSPEQARGRKYLTIRSDVFALGITLYELAAKQHPYNRDQHNIGRMEPRLLQEIRSDLPYNFTSLVHSMLNLVPAQRPINLVSRFQQLEETC